MAMFSAALLSMSSGSKFAAQYIQLTGYHIEIIRGDVEIDEEDIFLDDFADEIDEWVIDIPE